MASARLAPGLVPFDYARPHLARACLLCLCYYCRYTHRHYVLFYVGPVVFSLCGSPYRALCLLRAKRRDKKTTRRYWVAAMGIHVVWRERPYWRAEERLRVARAFIPPLPPPPPCMPSPSLPNSFCDPCQPHSLPHLCFQHFALPPPVSLCWFSGVVCLGWWPRRCDSDGVVVTCWRRFGHRHCDVEGDVCGKKEG